MLSMSDWSCLEAEEEREVSLMAISVALSMSCMGSRASEMARDLFFMSPTPTTMGVFLADILGEVSESWRMLARK